MTSAEIASIRDRARKTIQGYRSIEKLIGGIIGTRLERDDPSCNIVGFLAAPIEHLLRMQEAHCEKYIAILGMEPARAKIEADLLGPAKRCGAEEFNGKYSDFFSEINAVIELTKIGFTNFVAIIADPSARTSDYVALRNGIKTCIEIKHLRAPVTVFDFFSAKMRSAHESEPDNYAFSVGLTYPNDNTISTGKKVSIHSYVQAIKGRTPPFTDSLTFVDDSSILDIRVSTGSGGCFLSRYASVGDPSRINIESFLGKVAEKAERAMRQTENSNCARCLVIDIDTAVGEIDGDLIDAARAKVAETSRGHLNCVLLLYGHIVGRVG